MFKLTDVEQHKLDHPKKFTPRPGHGYGAHFKGRGTQRYSVPSGRAVNKQNPALRGQTNAIKGRLIEPHESDDSTPIQAAEHIGNGHAGIDVLTVRKAFRRMHGLSCDRKAVEPGVPSAPVASIRAKMKRIDVKAGETREGISTPLNCSDTFEIKDYSTKYVDQPKWTAENSEQAVINAREAWLAYVASETRHAD